MSTANETGKPFVITREFDAPRKLVWEVFTQPEHMEKWLSPAGSKTQHSKMDFRVGGTHHYCQIGPDGQPMWGKLHYEVIQAPEKLVYLQHFSDEQGGVTRHPLAPQWPEKMLTTVLFNETAPGRTEVILTWAAQGANAEEQAFFDNAHAGMEQGWGGTFQQLTDYLAKIQSR